MRIFVLTASCELLTVRGHPTNLTVRNRDRKGVTASVITEVGLFDFLAVSKIACNSKVAENVELGWRDPLPKPVIHVRLRKT
jgi:hypothetical protein